VRRACGPGWALVGDAGSFKDPLTAHGITDAFRDAELLANSIADGHIAEYAAIRDELSLPLFQVTDASPRSPGTWHGSRRCTANSAKR
jgi:menaquinone-9 beta-reductase